MRMFSMSDRKTRIETILPPLPELPFPDDDSLKDLKRKNMALSQAKAVLIAHSNSPLVGDLIAEVTQMDLDYHRLIHRVENGFPTDNKCRDFNLIAQTTI